MRKFLSFVLALALCALPCTAAASDVGGAGIGGDGTGTDTGNITVTIDEGEATPYETFAAAWTAAKAAKTATITLFPDATELGDTHIIDAGTDVFTVEADDNITLFVNGYGLGANGALICGGFTVTGGTFTIKGNNGPYSKISAPVTVNGGEVTTEACTIEGKVTVNGGKLNVNKNSHLGSLEVTAKDTCVLTECAVDEGITVADDMSPTELLADKMFYVYTESGERTFVAKGQKLAADALAGKDVQATRGTILTAVVVDGPQEVEAGGEFTLTAYPVAAVTEGAKYQWYKGTDELIEGATSATYKVTNAEAGTHEYSCKVTIGERAQTSEAFTVVVKAAPKDISGAVVTLEKDTITLGIDQPVVTSVVLDGVKLVEGTDYTVSVEETSSSQWTVVVTGKGNYFGSVNKVVKLEEPKPERIELTQKTDGGNALAVDVAEVNYFGPVPTPSSGGPAPTDEKIKTDLKAELEKGLGAGLPDDNVVFYDAKLMVNDGGTWKEATESDFPTGDGLNIKLPLPAEVNTTNVKVAHMFTGTNNPQYGKVEDCKNVQVDLANHQLTCTVTGLSPIAVGWAANSSGGNGGGIVTPPDPPVHKCPSLGYMDLDVKLWYHDATDYVIGQGLMLGVEPGVFLPQGVLSRAQLAQILYNRAGRPRGDFAGVFSDVPEGEWFTQAVNWAAQEGYVLGRPDGTFGPGEAVTREQLAVILWRRAGRPVAGGDLTAFTDGGTASGYAHDALCWAVEKSILQGEGDGLLRPRGTASRVEAAQILKNYFTLL